MLIDVKVLWSMEQSSLIAGKYHLDLGQLGLHHMVICWYL